jgi:cation diffusion facilitator family transporter
MQQARVVTISNRLATTASLVLSMLLTAAKLLIGLLTGSLSILADAIDSLLDILATGVTFLVVRVADLPPDDDHHYGHARADHLGALAQTVLLLATSAWIMWQAAGRILIDPLVPTVTPWVFAVVLISLAVNVGRVWLLRRASQQSGSQAVAANVANFSNDIFSSLIVLLTMLAIALRDWLALPVWFVDRIDALAAILVALVGLYLAWQTGKIAVRALMDNVPPDLGRRLTSRIAAMPDVLPDSTSLRMRFVGEQPFVEVTICTPRGRSLEEAHQLTEDVEQAIRDELHEAQVLVHVEPARPATEPYAIAVYSTAQRLGLRVHNLDIYQLADGVRIEMDLEMPASLTLSEAHRTSEELETAIAAEFPDCIEVAVHLEPRRDQVQPAVSYAPITQRVEQAVRALPDADAIAAVDTLLTDKGVIVTLRCTFPGSTRLTEVHTRMARIEQDLQRAISDVVRVQIDPEPLDLEGDERSSPLLTHIEQVPEERSAAR